MKRCAVISLLALGLAAPAAADTMAETVFACRDVDVLKGVLALSGQEQIDHYRSKLEESLCTRMVKAQTIEAIDRSSVPGFVKIKAPYEGEYWVEEIAVGK